MDKESRVTELMGFDHSYEFPCMYSGLVETDEVEHSNIFYWLFMSPKAKEDTKLVLWFSGGPGGSGQGSILDENGPLQFRVKDDKSVEVYSRIEESFAGVANVIYVDQPLGVGYSSSDKNVTKGKEVGETMLQFMLEFYELYPELHDQKLVIAGNSYAGHFIPNVVKEFLSYNKESNNQIPLDTMIVEDGYVDPITQRLSIKELVIGTGLLTLDYLSDYELLEQKCEQAFYLSPDTAFSDCKAMNSMLSKTDGNWGIMDVRYPAGYNFLPGDVVNNYFSTKEVQRQLHTITSESTIPFSSFNTTVYKNMRFDALIDNTADYNDIVNSGINTLIYTASLDGLDGALGTQLWLQNLEITQNEDFEGIQSVYHYNGTDSELHVGGTFKVYQDKDGNRMSYSTVYNAGHVLGNTQLPVSRALLEDMILQGQPKCRGNQCGITSG